jgi:hypothetical protein
LRAVKCTVAAAIISALACASTIDSAQGQAPPAQLNPGLQQGLSIYENQRMPECTVKWKAYKEQHKVDGTDAFRTFMSDCIGLSGPAGAPDEWKKFLSGQPFIATTSSNLQFRMTLTPNGKMLRDPIGTGGSKGEGTWSLSGNELCTAWAGTKPNCFVVRKKDEHNWSLMRGSTEAAVWTWTTIASPPTASTPIAAKTATSSSDSQALEFYALRTRLAALWGMPPDSKNPDELVVKIRMRLKPDGLLAAAPVVLSSGSSGPYVAASDSALRAASDAQPYSMLKADSYEAWKELEITFDPRGITAVSATAEQAAEAEAKPARTAEEARPDIIPSQQVVAAAHPISLAASSTSSTASDTSAQQTVTARTNAPEQADSAINQRDLFGAADMFREVAVHATLLLAVLGQFVLILLIIFRFSSPPHEKAMRVLAAGCGLLVYVGLKAAGISIPDAYRASSMGAISVGTFGVALPFAAGLSVAWYSVRTLAGRNPEQNVLGMRILSLVMTFIFFLFCDSYLRYGANEKREFVELLPNFTFVLAMMLYAVLCYRPLRTAAPAAAQSSSEPEHAREPQRYAGASLDRRHPAAASENARFSHRVPVASSREHVSLASAMRTRVGTT